MWNKTGFFEWTAKKLEKPAGEVVAPTGEEIRELTRQIEQAGGRAGFNPNAPAWVRRAFLDEINNCPDCQEAFRKADGEGKRQEERGKSER